MHKIRPNFKEPRNISTPRICSLATYFICVRSSENYWIGSIEATCHSDRPVMIGDCFHCETWWLIGRVDICRPEGRGCKSRSSRHVGTLGKSFTHSRLWRFGVKLRHSILCRERL